MDACNLAALCKLHVHSQKTTGTFMLAGAFAPGERGN